MLWGLAFIAAVLVCITYAAIYGQRPERIGAALMLAGTILTWLARDTFYASADLSILIIDIVMLVGLIALALWSDRYWTLWAAGFHTVGTVTHGAVMADTSVAPIAYAHALGLWGYLTLLSLAVGTWMLRRRLKPTDADGS